MGSFVVDPCNIAGTRVIEKFEHICKILSRTPLDTGDSASGLLGCMYNRRWQAVFYLSKSTAHIVFKRNLVIGFAAATIVICAKKKFRMLKRKIPVCVLSDLYWESSSSPHFYRRRTLRPDKRNISHPEYHRRLGIIQVTLKFRAATLYFDLIGASVFRGCASDRV